MIDKARERSVYDELIVDEMVACLSRHEAAFDLIASADTLVYFGELEPLFVATAHALRPGGWIVCTLECAADGDGGVRLNPNGRYSHSRQYVTDCLNRAGLSLLDIDRVELRIENKQPVAGMLVVAKR
jgi:predicted TPR repeat methyltransferase